MFIRALAIALAFIVPASYTLAAAGEDAPKAEGKKKEKKEKKDKGAKGDKGDKGAK